MQIAEAGRNIERQGWTVAPEHVYREDAVSRAEFKKRPALIAMINAAEAKNFDVIVCRDETRLGGDGPRTTLLIQDLIDAGVRLFYYVSDEEIALTDATAKFMVSVRNFAAELEREKIAGRVREHLMTKARRGYNAGGRCCGYDNVEVREGEQRVRVECAINAEQASIVREILERYAEALVPGPGTVERESTRHPFELRPPAAVSALGPRPMRGLRRPDRRQRGQERQHAHLDYIARHVLTEDVITDALKLLRRRLTDRVRGAGAEVKAKEDEAKRLQVEIANLVGALASGPTQPAPIVSAVAERQEKLTLLDTRIRAVKTAPEAISTELSRLEREARRRLADFRSALAADPTEARAFLAKIFTGPLIFTPEGNRYRIEGEIPAASVLFAGVPKYASPGGIYPLGSLRELLAPVMKTAA